MSVEWFAVIGKLIVLGYVLWVFWDLWWRDDLRRYLKGKRSAKS